MARKIYPCTCSFCGKEFLGYVFQSRRVKQGLPAYCTKSHASMAYQLADRRTKEQKCVQCGNTFQAMKSGGKWRQTCSDECAVVRRRNNFARAAEAMHERRLKRVPEVAFPAKWARDANYSPMEGWYGGGGA